MMANRKVDRAEILAANAPNIALGVLLLGVGVWLVTRDDGTGVDAFNDSASGPGRTLSDPQIMALVSRIREAFYGEFVTEDEASALAAIGACYSQSDLSALVVAFGTWAPITQPDRNLFQAVRAFVDSDDIDELNALLSSRGIKTLF